MRDVVSLASAYVEQRTKAVDHNQLKVVLIININLKE